MHVHNVRQTLANKGVPFDREVRIFDVCNPQRAKQVLEANPLMAAVLPCAIAVVSESGKATFVFVRPTAMLGLFDTDELTSVASDAEQTISRIVDTAAR